MVKVARKLNKNYFGSKQLCNYYLSRLQRLYLENDFCEFDSFQKAEERLSFLLKICIAESTEDLLYLPNKIIKVKTISDIIYFEAIYGKDIYKKDNYKQES
tara:strand:+ start:187 stop:489 length:303 start_codon:yes stop_codon:yes gene_type:complete